MKLYLFLTHVCEDKCVYLYTYMLSVYNIKNIQTLNLSVKIMLCTRINCSIFMWFINS